MGTNALVHGARRTVLVLALILALTTFLVTYLPLRAELEQNILENFYLLAESQVQAVEHFVSRSIEGAASLSSRTVIRQKAADYKANELSFEELAAFTAPRYQDGVAALEHLAAAARFVDGQVVVRVGEMLPGRVDRAQFDDKLEAWLHSRDEHPVIYVYSPLMDGSTRLGFDMLVFDMRLLMAELNRGMVQVHLYTPETHSALTPANGMVTYRTQLESLAAAVEVRAPRSSLFRPLVRLTVFNLLGVFIGLVGILAGINLITVRAARRVLDEVEASRRRLREEIERAHQLHRSLLPDDFPSNELLRFAVYHRSLDDLGGDIYDVRQIGRRMIVYLADVTGHGLEAAMMGAYVKATMDIAIATSPLQELTPTHMGNRLLAWLQTAGYPLDYGVAIFLAVIDLDTHEMTYTGAGFHTSPVLIPPDEQPLVHLDSPGLPLAPSIPRELVDLTSRRVCLSSGTRVLFSTDGLFDQRIEGQYYAERGLEVFQRCRPLSMQGLVDALVDDFREFSGNDQGDDVTFLAMDVKG